MAEETVIFSIDFQNSFTQIVQVKDAIADLKKENQELRKTIDEGTDASEEAAQQLARNEAALRQLTTEQRNLQKAVDNTIKANKEEKDSIAANRAELARLTAEYIKLGKPTKEQSERIKQLSDRLKEQEGAIGDTRRNVGNYTESIKDALKNVNIFGVNVGAASTAVKKGAEGFKSMAKGADGASLSFKGLGKAIIATGIGALALALIGLVKLFLKSEKGIELVSKAMTIFGAAINVIIRRVEQFATGVAFILNGDFSKGVDALSGSFKGLGNEITQTVKAANDLADAQERLEDLEIGFIERRAKIRAQIQDLRDIANDETKTYKERQKALEDALVLQEELTSKEAEIAKERLSAAQQTFEQSAKTDDDRRKFEEAKAAAFEDERNRTREKIKLENELNNLLKQGGAQAKKAAEELAKLDKEAKAAAFEDERKRFANLEKARQESLNTQLQNLEDFFKQEDLKAKEAYANGQVTLQEYNQTLIDNKIAYFDQQIIILDTFGQEVADKEIELQNAVLDNEIANNERKASEQERINETIKQLNQELAESDKELTDARITNAQDALNVIGGLAKEGSSIQKASFLASQGAALADMVVRTQESIQAIDTAAALQEASASIIPFPANIPIIAGIQGRAIAKKIQAGITGAIAAARIAATTIQGFAEGGEVMNVGGKPHSEGGTLYAGQDGNRFEVERGEKIFVLKRTASEYIDKLSKLNQAFGGKSWAQGTRYAAEGGFIDGGFSARQSANIVNDRLFGNDLETALRNFKPVVQVSEINRVQKNITQTVSVSEL